MSSFSSTTVCASAPDRNGSTSEAERERLAFERGIYLVSASTGRRGMIGRGVSQLAQRLPVTVDLYRSVRRPRAEFAVWRDLRRTRAEASFVRSTPPAPTLGTALVPLYRDDIFDTKMACILASALRLRAFTPVFVVPRRGLSRVDRYLRAFGFPPALPMSEPITAEEKRERDTHITRAQDLDFEQVRHLTFREHQLGTHVLSSIIRLTFDGSPDLHESGVNALASQVMKETIETYINGEHLFDRLDPRLVLVDEAGYSRNGPLVDIATSRGIDVIQTTTTWREDALISKRLTATTRRDDVRSVDHSTFQHYCGSALGADAEHELEESFRARYGPRWALSRQFQPSTATTDREHVGDMLGIDSGRPTAVIFSHVLWDATLFYGRDLFPNYGDWLAETAAAAIENDAVTWVIKAHPANAFRASRGDVRGESRELALLRSRFTTLPDHVRVVAPEAPISSLTVYELADIAVTVRGTPGLEMAALGRQVLTAGTGHFSNLGFTTDSESANEYLQRIRDLREPQPLSDPALARARCYAYLYFCRRPWLTSSFRQAFDFDHPGWRPLDRNVRLVAESIEELKGAEDLMQWAQWASSSEDIDFIQSRPPTT